MRLATKLALGVVTASTLVLGTSGILQLRHEEGDLRLASEHDIRILVDALQVAVEHALRDNQVPDIQAILERLELRDESIDVFVFDVTGDVMRRSTGSEQHDTVIEPLLREARAAGGPAVRFVGGMERLVAALPLRRDDGSPVGMLAVARPLDDLRTDLATTRRSILLSFASELAAISAVAWSLVILWVRIPLAKVTRGMQAVRSGNLSVRVPTPYRDEIGELAGEFNKMAEDLEETRRKLGAETESRRALQQGLQHVDKLVTIGQLSAGLAHEIGSPLQILNGRARTLLELPDASPEVKRQATIMVEQSDRVTRIVERLLGFSRRSAPRMTEVDLRPTIRTVLDLLEVEARKRRVELRFDSAPDLPRVRADPDRIQQIVLNLVNNAIKASKRGGSIQLTLHVASFGLGTGATPRPSVCLRVVDDGIGMDDAAVAGAFEPFFTHWPDSPGTGLGLAVVKAIVDDHGGAISLRSTLGEGTRIDVHLPGDESERGRERPA